MDKDKLRKEFLKKRKDFIPFKKPYDQKIFQRFINLPVVKKAETICLYVSKAGEVDTHELIKHFLDETVSFRVTPLWGNPSKAKRVVVPKVTGKNLELYEIKNFSDLSVGAFGILEPDISQATCYTLHVTDIDLFIVPGLVFSKSGSRIGFGKGYYDRLLKKTKGIKLGLAYSWQIVDKLPREKEDVLVDMILTEKDIFKRES